MTLKEFKEAIEELITDNPEYADFPVYIFMNFQNTLGIEIEVDEPELRERNFIKEGERNGRDYGILQDEVTDFHNTCPHENKIEEKYNCIIIQ